MSPEGNYRLFFSISKHKAKTTELHPKVRQTCLSLIFPVVPSFKDHFTLELQIYTFHLRHLRHLLHLLHLLHL